MNQKINVIQTIADLDLKSGGPSRSVTELNQYLNRTSSVSATIVTQRNPHQKIDEHLKANLRISYGSDIMVKLGLPLAHELRRAIAQLNPSLIHNHGVWHGANYWSSKTARNLGIPFIIQPHGMLESWALSFHKFKKQMAMALYQRDHLERAVGFVATSEMEYRNIRSLRLRQPIAVIPNGIADLECKRIEKKKPVAYRQRNFLFLSRVHPKKGLINLLQAWASIDTQGWMLNIAGPPEGNHLTEIQAEIARLGISSSVAYLGELYDEAKNAAYANADIFVLPTFSENFGIVVGEALLHGIPVLTTKGTPWSDLETYRAGWWIDIGVEPLKRALSEAIALTDNERHDMGERGYQLVQRFDWPTIAVQMSEFYQWLSRSGQRPPHVYVD